MIQRMLVMSTNYLRETGGVDSNRRHGSQGSTMEIHFFVSNTNLIIHIFTFYHGPRLQMSVVCYLRTFKYLRRIIFGEF